FGLCDFSERAELTLELTANTQSTSSKTGRKQKSRSSPEKAALSCNSKTTPAKQTQTKPHPPTRQCTAYHRVHNSSPRKQPARLNSHATAPRRSVHPAHR